MDWARWAPREGARLDCSCMPVDLAGAEEASHANCVVVDQRTLVAAVAWWWRCMAEWRGKGQGPRQWRNKCALIMSHLFVYTLPRGLPLGVVLGLD